MQVILNRKPIVTACLLSALTLSGCGFGVAVPELQERWDKPDEGDVMVKEIAKSVYLSVEKAVVCVVTTDNIAPKPQIDTFVNKWGVQMTLILTIMESTTLNPGLSLNTPMHAGVTNFGGEFLTSSTSPLAAITYPFVSTAQNYSLNFGGKASSQATRTETAGAYYNIGTLLRNAKDNKRYETEANSCDHQEIAEKDRIYYYKAKYEELSPTAQYLSLLTNNDLKIHEWLKTSLAVETAIADMGGNYAITGKDSSKSLGQNAITHEVQFVVLTEGSVTPQWKLVRVSANPTSTLFDTQRSRTHDLIITFGPKEPKAPVAGLADAAKNDHNAAVFAANNGVQLRNNVFQP